MAHVFLSDEWFAELDKLRDEAPEPPAQLKDLKLNLVVTGAPQGDIDAHIDGGQFMRGHVENAAVKLTVPFEVAKKLFIQGDQQAAMQAFMTGQIKAEGDVTKVMAMSAVPPSAEQQAFQDKVSALTE
jgi:putative sterol carrier protein